ncbi:flagellar hook-length control protein FliK [Glaciimonas sp. Gout2]|uniref:flagellar hook-length control protein FliK n=1 Tax=unclassified Glaciimonas TaxID=2644401 RepID=UPI002B232C10|nr:MULTISPECIES: flagellar hook-length control protein FliK [unclassified Glaciimonas]MEB0010214.1 flagellar hook-length control protein FliK [Glaciimonas sp. Cout2]MEB0083713.1 flagellar hook-length control protein FliK [Glaciimonas sp. Gout2]
MSGITPIVDTLLATTLTQRLDLVPLKSALQLSEPTAVTNAGAVNNDLRLPSRAATDTQLGRGLQPMRGAADVVLYSAETPPTLSATARAISAILGGPQNGPGSAVFIKGEAPLLPAMPIDGRASLPLHLLASVLARVVSHSGLFYESHLLQYSSGRRSLAQMAQEPQARLGTLVQSRPELFGANGTRADLPLWAEQARGMSSVLATTTSSRLSGFSMTSGSQDPTGIMESDHGVTTDRSSAIAPHVPQQLTNPSLPNTLGTSMLRAYSGQYTQKDTDPSKSDSSDDNGANDILLSEKNSAPSISQNDKTSVINSMTAEMRPDAAELVRQQLNFLASPVFRWQGEAWPGASMEWELNQQHTQRKDQPNSQNAQIDPAVVGWSTYLKLNLPSLGTLELRLHLAGQSIETNIVVGDNTNANLLRDHTADLRSRFIASGLDVTSLQISTSESTGADVEDDNVVKKR